MRMFLYEYTSAQPRENTRALHAEGWAMLEAAVEDFGKIPGVETVTLLDQTCPRPLGHFCRHIDKRQEEEVFRQLAGEAEFTLVIAPEFDDVLAERCRWVLESGGRLLGPGPEVISMAADKCFLAGNLTPPAILLPKSDQLLRSHHDFLPGVIKPRFGAGSQATFLVRTENQLDGTLAAARNEMPGAEFVLQRFVKGIPASVAFLVGPKTRLALLPSAQHLSGDGRFRYQGGELPLRANLAERAINFALRAFTAVPGLLGYIGIDLILGDAKDGSQDHVIEINPRLTTSYIGLRQLARTNLAEALLDLMTGKEIVDLRWRRGKVEFLADGTLLQEPDSSFRARKGKADAKR
jgi:predicted ATP-grasp superfamily ATP-dependent carboligase